ncbi:hypothetical protein AB0M19_10400 [Streptomyces sp. NPDC051920]|uniref:baeRF2 domain-containing protein n=1 Tax=Streptomyces sp. NPDC051920 TaxID=3155523 RepID=UPI00341569E2
MHAGGPTPAREGPVPSCRRGRDSSRPRPAASLHRGRHRPAGRRHRRLAGTLDSAHRRSYSGSTLRITRVKAGGPSTASYQRSTESVWSTNATGAADKIVATAEAVGAFRIRRRCRQGNRGPA